MKNGRATEQQRDLETRVRALAFYTEKGAEGEAIPEVKVQSCRGRLGESAVKVRRRK